MKTYKAKFFITFFSICIIASMIAINVIPRGNFIGGPFLFLFIYLPLSCIQLFFLARVWLFKNNSEKVNQRMFYASLVLLLIVEYLLFDYLINTS